MVRAVPKDQPVSVSFGIKVIARKGVNFVKFFSIITLDMTGTALYNGAE
jgi:hypothetical protein